MKCQKGRIGVHINQPLRENTHTLKQRHIASGLAQRADEELHLILIHPNGGQNVCKDSIWEVERDASRRGTQIVPEHKVIRGVE